MTKISIITPCYNSERLIGETIESILKQSAVVSGRVKLEYIICDGRSVDRTLGVIDSLRNDAFTVISEPDLGMYDALAKGLRRATGDIVAYINAGDIYNSRAFDVVLDVFQDTNVKWLTGCNVFYNERSEITAVTVPFKYRSGLFACGIYGRYLHPVQQESTFWSSSLNGLIDFDVLAGQKYAGDFYLWSRFAAAAELKIVESHLGGFKFHAGQLSENRDAYLKELKTLSRDPRLHEYVLAFMDRILSFAPSKVKKILNSKGFIRYDHREQRWT